MNKILFVICRMLMAPVWSTLDSVTASQKPYPVLHALNEYYRSLNSMSSRYLIVFYCFSTSSIILIQFN